jgi:hypothetical protein
MRRNASTSRWTSTTSASAAPSTLPSAPGAASAATSTHAPSRRATALRTSGARSPSPARTTSSRWAIESARGCATPRTVPGLGAVACGSRTAEYTSRRMTPSTSRVRARIAGSVASVAGTFSSAARRTSLQPEV